MVRRETNEILLRQLKKPHRRSQTAAVFRMSRIFEILLQMDKRARGLDQAFKKIIVGCLGIKPEVLKNIVRFVITLIVPAAKIGAIEGMIGDPGVFELDIFVTEPADEL